jgi:hypothetical protein
VIRGWKCVGKEKMAWHERGRGGQRKAVLLKLPRPGGRATARWFRALSQGASRGVVSGGWSDQVNGRHPDKGFLANPGGGGNGTARRRVQESVGETTSSTRPGWRSCRPVVAGTLSVNQAWSRRPAHSRSEGPKAREGRVGAGEPRAPDGDEVCAEIAGPRWGGDGGVSAAQTRGREGVSHARLR